MQKPTSPFMSLAYGCTCLPVAVIAVILGILTAIYFYAPGETNIIILGVDFTGEESSAGRSDTNILATIIPGEPYVGMLSIPRDLWLTIPGFGENRINTAHFFGEANQPGAGPVTLKETIRQNFGVQADHFVRINFKGFKEVVDAMGGLEIELTEPLAGYEPGSYRLTGKKALAFARNRAGTDDFYRMKQGQLVVKSVLKQMALPTTWPRLPAVLTALPGAVDTDIPFWLWPRLGYTLLLVGPSRIDSRAITREMVTPYTTDQGASVLLPVWERINPLVSEIFGR